MKTVKVNVMLHLETLKKYPENTTTGLQGYINTSYKELEKVFGKPVDQKSIDGKVSTEWLISTNIGFFTIYDYKATSAYDPSLPSVGMFRKLKSYEWHVGGKNKETTLAFIEALEAILN